jgi:hypothetical protein
MPLAVACGEENADGMSRIGPAGIPASSRRASLRSAVSVANRSATPSSIVANGPTSTVEQSMTRIPRKGPSFAGVAGTARWYGRPFAGGRPEKEGMEDRRPLPSWV